MSIRVSELPTLTVVDGTTLLAVVDTSSGSTSKQTTIEAVTTHVLAGNAATATKLQTARTINGNSFDGTANISITPSQIGLGNVTNESKSTMFTSPTFTGTVTIPSGASISGFAPLASPAFTGTVTGITKGMVGLSLVENTALSTWAGSANITTLGTVTSGSAPAGDVYAWAKQPTKPTYSASEVGLGNVTNESKATMFTGPTFTGTVSVPTPAPSSNTTVAASTAYVTAAITTAVNGLINGAGAALDTLDELAAALGDDANFASTVTSNLALKAPLASPTFTGTVTIPAGASIDGYALLNSPSFTTPTLGVATATTINKVTITAPATSATLTIANGKTFTVNNSITLGGTDSTSITLPSTTGTVALNNQNFYIGTTQVAINRTSGNLVLTGITSIDGNAATATSAGKSTNLTGGNSTTLLGTIHYQSDVDISSVLSPNTSTTKKFLRQTGDGTNGAAPAWDTVTATDVGLGNVTNESKATMFESPTFTGTVSGVTATMVGLGNVTNESKATMFESPTFTGTVSGVTATHVGLGNVTNESKATMFSSPTFTGVATFAGQAETVTVPTVSNSITFDSQLSNVFYFQPSNDFTAVFSNVSTTGTKAITFTLVLSQSLSPRMMTAVNINGTGSQTISWVGGSQPAGSASKTDVVNVTLIYISSALAKVLASVATYG